jgi:site-specific recombinase XerD
MDAYKKYEKNCKKIREANEGLLTDFETWLISFGLAPKTIVQHISNVDFFINDYLLYEDAIEAFEGVHKVSMYLGYWFIRKAMWASASSIRSNAASIKKFYAFMLAKGLVDPQALDILAQTFKEDMPTWLAQMKRHDQDALEMDDDY